MHYAHTWVSCTLQPHYNKVVYMHTLEYPVLITILLVLFTNELRATGELSQLLKINTNIKYRKHFKTSNTIF